MIVDGSLEMTPCDGRIKDPEISLHLALPLLQKAWRQQGGFVLGKHLQVKLVGGSQICNNWQARHREI